MNWGHVVLGLLSAFVIATVTTPVGVSGAVFLLPVQLSILHIPNPSVTPTNLMYNIIATPGGIFRYLRAGGVDGPLARRLLAGTVPGVIVGAVLRVYVVPGPRVFRLVVACVLLPLGAWLIARTVRPHTVVRSLSAPQMTGMALMVGVVGGVYGIGGGSILGPILVGSGLTVAAVAPAALMSTFATSIVGAATYVVLSTVHSGSIAPSWTVGIACGVGGLLGGYLGARLQPRLPERMLRLLLGGLAVAFAFVYFAQALGLGR